LAKAKGAVYVPQLTRASFKKKTNFDRIMKEEGAEAAMNYLLGETG
jgi:hypothetical protein